eukprot:m51a1_g3742 hypothetical protein (626) ;mRNA; f:54136-56013
MARAQLKRSSVVVLAQPEDFFGADDDDDADPTESPSEQEQQQPQPQPQPRLVEISLAPHEPSAPSFTPSLEIRPLPDAAEIARLATVDAQVPLGRFDSPVALSPHAEHDLLPRLDAFETPVKEWRAPADEEEEEEEEPVLEVEDEDEEENENEDGQAKEGQERVLLSLVKSDDFWADTDTSAASVPAPAAAVVLPSAAPPSTVVPLARAVAIRPLPRPLFEMLPDALIHAILCRVPRSSLAAFARTCRHAHALCSDPRLWRSVVVRCTPSTSQAAAVARSPRSRMVRALRLEAMTGGHPEVGREAAALLAKATGSSLEELYTHGCALSLDAVAEFASASPPLCCVRVRVADSARGQCAPDLCALAASLSPQARAIEVKRAKSDDCAGALSGLAAAVLLRGPMACLEEIILPRAAESQLLAALCGCPGGESSLPALSTLRAIKVTSGEGLTLLARRCGATLRDLHIKQAAGSSLAGVAEVLARCPCLSRFTVDLRSPDTLLDSRALSKIKIVVPDDCCVHVIIDIGQMAPETIRELAPLLSRASTLVIYLCVEGLTDILRACPRLVEAELHIAEDYKESFADSVSSGEILGALAETLQVLKVDTENVELASQAAVSRPGLTIKLWS